MISYVLSFLRPETGLKLMFTCEVSLTSVDEDDEGDLSESLKVLLEDCDRRAREDEGERSDEPLDMSDKFGSSAGESKPEWSEKREDEEPELWGDLRRSRDKGNVLAEGVGDGVCKGEEAGW